MLRRVGQEIKDAQQLVRAEVCRVQQILHVHGLEARRPVRVEVESGSCPAEELVGPLRVGASQNGPSQRADAAIAGQPRAQLAGLLVGRQLPERFFDALETRIESSKSNSAYCVAQGRVAGVEP